MIKKTVLFCFVILFLTSCKTLSISQASQIKTIEPLVLGSIGSGKEFILQNEFNQTSYPAYKKPIKVSVLKTPFNKSTYKSFLKAKNTQSCSVSIKYIDSLKEKPYYIKLKIADKVSLVTALNSKINNHVKNHLSISPSANLITGLSIAINKDHFKKIEQAKSVFLIEKYSKIYALELYLENNTKEVLYFNEGVVFGYKTANCCWQENNKRQLNIVDLVNRYTNCPKKAYHSANRAENKVNYFKI